MQSSLSSTTTGVRVIQSGVRVILILLASGVRVIIILLAGGVRVIHVWGTGNGVRVIEGLRYPHHFSEVVKGSSTKGP